MANIYDLKDSYLIVQDMILNGDEELEEVLKTISDEIEVKADGYASIIANLTSDIEGIKAEEKRLKERRQSFEASIVKLKETLYKAMKETGKTKFKTNLFSFNIAKNGGAKPIVMKVDVSELPDNLVIIKEEPDKKAIAKYIEDTGDLTYAEFGERGESLRIK